MAIWTLLFFSSLVQRTLRSTCTLGLLEVFWLVSFCFSKVTNCLCMQLIISVFIGQRIDISLDSKVVLIPCWSIIIFKNWKFYFNIVPRLKSNRIISAATNFISFWTKTSLKFFQITWFHFIMEPRFTDFWCNFSYFFRARDWNNDWFFCSSVNRTRKYLNT